MKSIIAIEIGTSYTKIYKSRAGVVLCEPTMIAIAGKNYKKPIAVGKDAQMLIGKTQSGVRIIKPINNTDILDVKALVVLISTFYNKIKQVEIQPNVILTVQCGSSREVLSNFETALNKAGLYNITFAESPILALLGAGVPLSDKSCSAIIDIGGGQTTVCALNMNGIISGVSAGYGGNALTKLIMRHAETALNLTLSEHQVEELKCAIASTVEDDDTKAVVQGKETSSGRPRSLNVYASQLIPPVNEFTSKIIEIANLVINKLNGDILKEITLNGIYLTGGGSKLFGLADYLKRQLNFNVIPVKEADLSVILGAGMLTEDKVLHQKLRLKF